MRLRRTQDRQLVGGRVHAADDQLGAAFFLPGDVLLEFLTVLLDDGLDRIRGTIGQAADAQAPHHAHVRGDFDDQVEILGAAGVERDPGGDLVHPARAFTTLRALAAAFVSVEAGGVHEHLAHIGAFCDHDQAGGSEAEQSVFFHGVKIERAIELVEILREIDFAVRRFRKNVAAQDAHRKAAWNDAFDFLSVLHAAAVVVAVDQLARGDAAGGFETAGTIDRARYRVELGAAGALRANAEEPVRAAVDDVWNAAERFDVVH